MLLIAAGASLWGLDALLRKPLTNEWSPYTIVLYEHAILTACVLPILLRHRDQLARLTRDLAFGFVATGHTRDGDAVEGRTTQYNAA